jgi:hypothetical protein
MAVDERQRSVSSALELTHYGIPRLSLLTPQLRPEEEVDPGLYLNIIVPFRAEKV